ncbi:uncharacterized protein EDB91DRAFT_896415 [Suillus paluster]|uniref:uncharacterized protein n=1 Tax=Suillus paluster TaxID=48578 RepID=UPI001B86FCB4|nr:uncharacterized protein EDB91DRAFT_896415 [Suillus paluster]KAG1727191.1 hypothetical protein EDB91DRAFT_896415 [Suillus paluster]
MLSNPPVWLGDQCLGHHINSGTVLQLLLLVSLLHLSNSIITLTQAIQVCHGPLLMHVHHFTLKMLCMSLSVMTHD